MVGLSLIFFGECWVLAGTPRTVAVGERAAQDVVTPVPLIVIDPDRTVRIRLQEAQRIAPILRARPEATSEALVQLQLAFATNRQSFLEDLQIAYKRTQLSREEVEQPKFRRFVSTFQRQRRFPITSSLGELWAQGQSDEGAQAELACQLREAMAHLIRPDELPAEARVGPAQWRLLPSNSTAPVADVNAVLKASTPVHRTNILALSRARKDLLAGFPPAEQTTGRLLAGIIRENCFIDAETTRHLRASRTNDIWAADHYTAGQIIVKAGDVIDARAKAAIDKLEEKLAADRAQVDLVHALGKAQASMSSLKKETESARRQLWWMSLLAIPGVAAGVGLWRLRRKFSQEVYIPATETVALISNGQPEAVALPSQGALPAVAHSWRTRAIAAERRVQKLTYALRARLAPQLARWIAHKFIQQLVSNRRNLLELQKRAEAEIAALERRLVELQAPLEERLRAYENRIIQLERQLSAKDQENHDLVEFAIAAARRKLDRERTFAGLEWD